VEFSITVNGVTFTRDGDLVRVSTAAGPGVFNPEQLRSLRELMQLVAGMMEMGDSDSHLDNSRDRHRKGVVSVVPNRPSVRELTATGLRIQRQLLPSSATSFFFRVVPSMSKGGIHAQVQGVGIVKAWCP